MPAPFKEYRPGDPISAAHLNDSVKSQQQTGTLYGDGVEIALTGNGTTIHQPGAELPFESFEGVVANTFPISVQGQFYLDFPDNRYWVNRGAPMPQDASTADAAADPGPTEIGYYESGGPGEPNPLIVTNLYEKGTHLLAPSTVVRVFVEFDLSGTPRYVMHEAPPQQFLHTFSAIASWTSGASVMIGTLDGAANVASNLVTVDILYYDVVQNTAQGTNRVPWCGMTNGSTCGFLYYPDTFRIDNAANVFGTNAAMNPGFLVGVPLVPGTISVLVDWYCSGTNRIMVYGKAIGLP